MATLAPSFNMADLRKVAALAKKEGVCIRYRLGGDGATTFEIDPHAKTPANDRSSNPWDDEIGKN